MLGTDWLVNRNFIFFYSVLPFYSHDKDKSSYQNVYIWYPRFDDSQCKLVTKRSKKLFRKDICLALAKVTFPNLTWPQNLFSQNTY